MSDKNILRQSYWATIYYLSSSVYNCHIEHSGLLYIF